MRAAWERIQIALVSSVMTLEMNQHFEEARHVAAALRPFATVASLLEFLDVESPNRDDKDAVYRALVHAVQTRARWAPFATAVLWCGLWPGLNALQARQRRYAAGDLDDLTSLIGLVFTAQLAQLDLREVRRVAATLVRNTGRDVARVRARQAATTVHPASSTEPPDPDTVVASTLDMPVGLSTASQVAYLQRWLRRIVGDDAGWFLAVEVFGVDPQVVARQLRVSPALLRKRIQRIRTQLQRSFSQNTIQNGMCFV